MFKGKSAYLAVIMALAAVAFVGQAMSQDSRPANPPGPGGPWGPGAGRGDPEQMKKMMAEFRKQAETRMKEAMGATDEEWTVLQPKIEKVAIALAQSAGGVMGRMGAMFSVGGADDPNKVPDVTAKSQALQKILQNKEAKTEDILAALKEYRDARDKAKEELVKAQKELKEVLTARQEAQLVAMGLLE